VEVSIDEASVGVNVSDKNKMIDNVIRVTGRMSDRTMDDDDDDDDDVCACVSAGGGCQVNNGGCEHLCITGDNGHFHCRCHPGFTLRNDARTCQRMTSVDYSHHRKLML